MSIFLPLLKLQFLGLKLIVFYPKYQKTIFSDKISVKTTIRESSTFGQKPRTNPFKKMSFYWPLLKLQFFGLKTIVFYIKYPEKILAELISVKNSEKTKFDCWAKTMD